MYTKDHHQDDADMILSKSQLEEMSTNLTKLAEKLNINAVLLVTSSGEPVAQKLKGPWNHYSTLISTLTASSFAAAGEIARILGEKSNFKMVLHEGEQNNVFVCTVNQEYFLIVIFESGVPVGIVRLFTKKTIARLLPILYREEKERPGLNQIFDQSFQSELSEAINRSFSE